MTIEELFYNSTPLPRKTLDTLATVIEKRKAFMQIYKYIYIPALQEIEKDEASIVLPIDRLQSVMEKMKKDKTLYPQDSISVIKLDQLGNKQYIFLDMNAKGRHNALRLQQVICVANFKILSEQSINDSYNIEELQEFSQETSRLKKLLDDYRALRAEYDNELKQFITGERTAEYKAKRKALIAEKGKRMQEYANAYSKIAIERSERMIRGEQTKDLTEQGRRILAEKLKVQVEYDKKLQELSYSRTPTEEQKAQVDEWIRRNTELREQILKAVCEAGYAI